MAVDQRAPRQTCSTASARVTAVGAEPVAVGVAHDALAAEFDARAAGVHPRGLDAARDAGALGDERGSAPRPGRRSGRAACRDRVGAASRRCCSGCHGGGHVVLLFDRLRPPRAPERQTPRGSRPGASDGGAVSQRRWAPSAVPIEKSAGLHTVDGDTAVHDAATASQPAGTRWPSVSVGARRAPSSSLRPRPRSSSMLRLDLRRCGSRTFIASAVDDRGEREQHDEAPAEAEQCRCCRPPAVGVVAEVADQAQAAEPRQHPGRAGPPVHAAACRPCRSGGTPPSSTKPSATATNSFQSTSQPAQYTIRFDA